MNNSIHLLLADILEQTGRPECTTLARNFKENPSSSLHFRSLNLTSKEISEIAAVLVEHKDSSQIKSISFSYNQLSTKNLTLLLSSFPSSLLELGLVDCALTDECGPPITQWIKRSKNLRMICVEGNDFSEEVKIRFKKDSKRMNITVFI